MLGGKQEDPKVRAARKSAGPALGFGSSFAGGMAFFGIGGHWLDGRTGREPLFTLIGIGLGLLYGAWELWKLIVMTNQQAKERGLNQAEIDEEHQNEPPK